MPFVRRKSIINPEWDEILKPVLPILKKTLQRIEKVEQAGKIVFPPKRQRLAVFDMEMWKIKVVILGADPYPKKGQANGLAFAVNKGVKPPKSLVTILDEVATEYDYDCNSYKIIGDLSEWTNQGVMLLNTSLTVEEGKPGSHETLGWETVTDEVVRQINKQREGVVFLLWGYASGQKLDLINARKHHVLIAPHPVARDGRFLGNGHFRQANVYLKNQRLTEIDWKNVIDVGDADFDF